jgi:uncharacterized protein (TIGR02594 family)
MARGIELTAYDLAMRFVGMREVPGTGSNPAVLAMLKLDQTWPEGDEVAWCSGFANYICWLLRLPRSKSLRARSWLGVGASVALHEAEAGFDVAILSRGENAPGPEVLDAPGHVGFFSGWEQNQRILLLGGNQGDSVNVAPFDATRLLGIRRLRG